ncbi:MAG TPA: CapA family protein [Polyangia bacterium]|nr:CapA family protein [Polyangia bacterium]
MALAGCAAQPLRVVAAGDLQLDGAGRADPLAQLAILDGDVRFVNLEGPLTTRGAPSGLDADGRPSGGAIHFQAPPERARWLAGRVDVASLANNHALDQGAAGRDDTARALAAAGVQPAWRDHDAELRRRGRRVIVLARDFPPGAELDGASELVDAVARARRRGVVLVSLHWGETGSLLPSDAQRRFAARLADAGAAAVIGHGPHALQGLERRGGAVIAYSLGNLAFGCRCTDAADAYALAFTIDARGRAADARAIPLEAGLSGNLPHPSRDPGLLELIETLSRDLGSHATRTDGTVRIR